MPTSEALKKFSDATSRISRADFNRLTPQQRKNIQASIPELVVYDDSLINERLAHDRSVADKMRRIIEEEAKRKNFIGLWR